MNELIVLVAKMREYQKQYFEARRKGMPTVAKQVLQHAKDYEARVDKMLQEMQGEIPATQKELF
jgi:hypothetical protein